MACGLEVRAPFLDHAMVELAGRIPSRLKVHGLTTKYILKEALRGLLPAEILERRKQGFGVPVGRWLRGPLRGLLEEWLRPERVAEIGLFDAATTTRLVDEHVAGHANHAKVLWGLLGLVTVFYLVGVEAIALGVLCAWCTALHVLIVAALGIALFRAPAGEEAIEPAGARP